MQGIRESKGKSPEAITTKKARLGHLKFGYLESIGGLGYKSNHLIPQQMIGCAGVIHTQASDMYKYGMAGVGSQASGN